jgi:hypothetical protein
MNYLGRMITKTIVISHYNEDLSWINNLNVNYTDIRVYTESDSFQKNSDRVSNIYHLPINKGNEASCYLKYILDNYDNFPAYTIFIHAHEYSPHHAGSTQKILNELIDMKTYYHNFNNYNLGYILTNPLIDHILKWYTEYLENELGPIEDYGDWTPEHKGCAQFLVHRSLILSRSKEFYQKLYDWIITTDLPNAWTGRFLEWTWHLMWRQVPKITE